MARGRELGGLEPATGFEYKQVLNGRRLCALMGDSAVLLSISNIS